MPHHLLPKRNIRLAMIAVTSLIVVIISAVAMGHFWHKDTLRQPNSSQSNKTPLRQSSPSKSNNTTPDTDLNTAAKKEIAMQLVSAAENSSLDWRSQYGYIEYNVEGNDVENRGYTAGLIGFTSATGDMLTLVQYYQQLAPGNILEKYIPALERVNGTAATTGLGDAFMRDWKVAASSGDDRFRAAQNYERDHMYFIPAVELAQSDGLHELGQFAYYDAAVMHGEQGLSDIRTATLQKASPPSKGGDETGYLSQFLDARKAAMLKEIGHSDTGRVDTMQRKFLQERNLRLTPPLTFSVYGDSYTIR